jgi:hypothetical protein
VSSTKHDLQPIDAESPSGKRIINNGSEIRFRGSIKVGKQVN